MIDRIGLYRLHSDPSPSSPPDEPSGQTTGIGSGERPRVIAVWIILAAIIVSYILSSLLSGSLFQPSLRALLVLGAKENSLIDQGQYWRLLTATFLHGNLVHIFFNSFALYALGPESERIYGTARFLALYFIAGIGGSVASYLMSPVPSVGASGAIFGLIGGLGIFFYLNRQILGAWGRAQVQSMAAIAGINLVIGFSAPGVIDNWGHLGGLMAGLAVGFALAPRLTVNQTWFPPTLVRHFESWGWGMAVAVFAVLSALAVVLPGAS